MIPFAALGAVKAFLPTSLAEVIRLVFVAMATLLLGQCQGARGERSAWEAKAAEMRVIAERLQRAADAHRQASETLDRQRIATNRQEIDDVLKAIPDQALSARQRALFCHELRRQNAPASAVDTACGPAQPSR